MVAWAQRHLLDSNTSEGGVEEEGEGGEGGEGDSDCVLVENEEAAVRGGGGAKAAAPPADPNDEEGEEMIVGEKYGFLHSAPHARAECPTYPFQRGGAPGNTSFCPSCFCYVCDSPAKSCTAWPGDHCNAYLDSGVWKAAKEAHSLRKHTALQQQV